MLLLRQIAYALPVAEKLETVISLDRLLCSK